VPELKSKIVEKDSRIITFYYFGDEDGEKRASNDELIRLHKKITPSQSLLTSDKPIDVVYLSLSNQIYTESGIRTFDHVKIEDNLSKDKYTIIDGNPESAPEWVKTYYNNEYPHSSDDEKSSEVNNKNSHSSDDEESFEVVSREGATFAVDTPDVDISKAASVGASNAPRVKRHTHSTSTGKSPKVGKIHSAIGDGKSKKQKEEENKTLLKKKSELLQTKTDYLNSQDIILEAIVKAYKSSNKKEEYQQIINANIKENVFILDLADIEKIIKKLINTFEGYITFSVWGAERSIYNPLNHQPEELANLTNCLIFLTQPTNGKPPLLTVNNEFTDAIKKTEKRITELESEIGAPDIDKSDVASEQLLSYESVAATIKNLYETIVKNSYLAKTGLLPYSSEIPCNILSI